MSDDQFTQIMERFARLEAAVTDSNRLASQALSVANGTASTLMILFDNVDKRLKAIEEHLFPPGQVN